MKENTNMAWYYEIAGRGTFRITSDRFSVASKMTAKALRRQLASCGVSVHQHATKADLVALACDTGSVVSVAEGW